MKQRPFQYVYLIIFNFFLNLLNLSFLNEVLFLDLFTTVKDYNLIILYHKIKFSTK